MAMLVASEATLFGTFIGSYYYLRFESAALAAARDARAARRGAADHGRDPRRRRACRCSSRRTRRGAGGSGRARFCSSWALIVQCGYLVWAIHDYVHQLHVSTPQDNAYSSIYYMLLGADHAHVAVGILLVVWLLWKLAARPDDVPAQRRSQAVAFYWHAVNLLTLIVIGARSCSRDIVPPA